MHIISSSAVLAVFLAAFLISSNARPARYIITNNEPLKDFFSRDAARILRWRVQNVASAIAQNQNVKSLALDIGFSSS
ncbi:hypothetical protein E2P81_ATG07616 [Venturia nashicola]|nr:hypothetical protein E2P81_ATG07616 [Venturia nashicola]